MMSASQMSAMIRAKKKKMEEDPDVVDESGHHMDGQDVFATKQREATDALDENMPMAHSDGMDTSPMEEMDEEKRAQKAAKMQKIRLMMGKLQMDI